MMLTSYKNRYAT